MRIKAIRSFLKLEAASGIILCLTALCAIIVSNSPWASAYQSLQQLTIQFQLGSWHPHTSLLFVVNDGLMTLFFLVVGLELKRECTIGVLREVKQILLPGIAAIGGMVVPALIYTIMNWSDATGLRGWATPVATDIAFALGVLQLFGKRVPLALKLFLTMLAIFDDMGAILIIAIFNTQALSGLFLLLAGLVVGSLWLLNRLHVRMLFPYLLLGCVLWICLLQSGVHPTIAGVLLAIFIPASERSSPLQRLEQELHGPVAHFVMPFFAFMNAGLSFHGMHVNDLLDNVTLGVILGLFLGKQLGVFGSVFAMIKLRWASLPENTTWLQLYGVAILCGIGFTMSLFLGTLAFENGFSAYLIKVRLGVLTASLFSSLVGALVLHRAFKKRRKTT